MTHDPFLHFEHVTDQELVARVKDLALREKRSTANLVAHLAELDARRLYLSEGCGSLYLYCTQVLNLSEHASFNRIEVARASRRFPRILERLADGSAHLAGLRLLAPYMTGENHLRLLDATRNKSKRQVEEFVAQLRPEGPARLGGQAGAPAATPGGSVQPAGWRPGTPTAPVPPLPVAPPTRAVIQVVPGGFPGGREGQEAALPQLPGLLPASPAGSGPPAGDEGAGSTALPGSPWVERAAPDASGVTVGGAAPDDLAAPVEGAAPVAAPDIDSGEPDGIVLLVDQRHPARPLAYRIHVTVPAETHARLRQAQELMRHQLPSGDVAAIVDRALQLLIDRLERIKFGKRVRPEPPDRRTAEAHPGGRPAPATAASRFIPAGERRLVWRRDGGRCAFVSSEGRRCTVRGGLEFHHVVPFARGGASRADNLQLRCRAHNVYESEVVFGPGNPERVRRAR